MNKEIPSTQKALQYQEYGDPGEVLTLVELPVPEPGPGEVLIEMQASDPSVRYWIDHGFLWSSP